MKRIFIRIKLDFMKRKSAVFLKVIVFTILFSLLFTSLMIRSTANTLQEELFSTTQIYASITSKINDLLYEPENTHEYFSDIQKYYEMTDKLAENKAVTYYDFSILSLIANDTATIEPVNIDLTTKEITFYALSGDDYLLEISKCYFTNEICYYDSPKLKSVQQTDFIDFQFKDVFLPDFFNNRSFTQKEMTEGANVCIVPQGFSLYTISGGKITENKPVEIGDTITLSAFIKDNDGNFIHLTPYEFKVIGSYQTTSGTGLPFNGNSGYIQHPLYIPHITYTTLLKDLFIHVTKIRSDLLEGNSKYFLTTPAVYKIQDIDGLKSFLHHFEPYYDNNNLELSFYSTITETLTPISNILSLSKSFTYISVITLTVSIIILFMVLLFEISHRRQEIGILLSFGEQKSKIIFQFICEVLIVSLLSIFPAYLCTQRLASLSIDYIINTKQENKIENGILEGAVDTDFSEMSININDEVILSASVYICILLIFEGAVLMIYIHSISPKELMNGE